MRKNALSLACAGVLCSCGAHAQQAQPAQGEKEKPVATVEVKAGADALRRNDTASRIVVTHDELTRYGDTGVLDALKRVPGVTVAGSEVRLRGLGSGYTQVLVNGDRPPAGFSLEDLSPELVEKIEVIRAATAEYSTQSIAGTINIVLRKAVSRKTREMKLHADGQGDSHLSGVTLALADKLAGAAWTLGANIFHQDIGTTSRGSLSVRAPSSPLAEARSTASASRNLANKESVTARITWPLGAGNSLTWQAFGMNAGMHGGTGARTVTLLGPAYLYPEFSERYDIVNSTARTELEWVARFGNGSKLDTKAGLDGTRIERTLHRWGWNDVSQLLLDSQDTNSVREKGVTWSGKYSVPLAETHAFAFGWDAGRSRYREADGRGTVAAVGDPFDFDVRFEAALARLALYAQDEWEVTPRWSLYLGARWEGLGTDTAGSGIAPAASRSSVFSPLMQALWKLPGAQRRQVRLALTRTYRAPQLSQLVARRYYTAINTQVSPDFAGNPRLQPELASGIDAAYEHYFSEGALVSVSAASREISNFIRSRLRLDGERWVWFPDNQGRAHVHSVEFEMKFPLRAFVKTAPALDLRASASRNWSRVDQVPGPDNRLDRQPAWSANLGADFRHGALSGGASLVLSAGGWTRTAVYQETYASVRRDLEAYALYKLTASSQVRFTALNLLRPDTLWALHYHDDSTVQDSASVRSTWRGWRVQYEYKF